MNMNIEELCRCHDFLLHEEANFFFEVAPCALDFCKPYKHNEVIAMMMRDFPD
jgi:hypothetical protein